ncbi:MAG: arsenic resistance N-acetyltransferase ArsN2 [Bacteroidota bacterium]|nr:arsenic resistance N-acetyltransferase ArsN2 [Bacteroidota bacterium]
MPKSPAANLGAAVAKVSVNGELISLLITTYRQFVLNEIPPRKFYAMNIREASIEQRAAIIALLQSQGLPTRDLPLSLQDFYVAQEEEKLVGLIGMERYGQFGLLRSMVVHPDYRNRHIAERLVQMLEEKGAASGLLAMYLLTETAENYFTRKGYTKVDRDAVPASVKASSEFSHVCPVSATVMKKEFS